MFKKLQRIVSGRVEEKEKTREKVRIATCFMCHVSFVYPAEGTEIHQGQHYLCGKHASYKAFYDQDLDKN